MKKNIFSVAAVLVAGLFASCTVSAPKANLKGASQADSLSYAIGVVQSQGLKDYVVMRMGVDTTYMDQFIAGLCDGVDADGKQSAYYAGIQIGQQEATQVLPGLAGEVLGDGELNKKEYAAGFVAGVTEKGQKMEPALAQETAMRLMESLKETADSTADLKAQIDTFSYAVGLARTQGLKEYAMFRLGVDSAHYASTFAKGVNEGFSLGENAKKGAFLAGVQIGQQLAGQMIPGITMEVFGENGELNKDFFMAGFVAGVTGEGLYFDAMQANQLAMRLMEEIKSERMDAEFGDYKAECDAFLDSIAQAEGVVKTASGLCYKVITKGEGAIPTATDKVKVHYRGTLINGEEFDSSYSRGEAAEFGVNQVIAGWTEALTLMPVGSKWELYIPQELAYGSRDMGQIKPYSTLVFEVELFDIVAE